MLVSDLRSPVLLIPGDFNLHMDVTSDSAEFTVLHDSLQLCQQVPPPALKGYDFINSVGLIIRV